MADSLRRTGRLPPLYKRDARPAQQTLATRDYLWEELVSVCGGDSAEMTKSERGRFNRALKELREVGATPEDIRKRAGQYRAMYTGAALTPTALAANWSKLKPPPSRYAVNAIHFEDYGAVETDDPTMSKEQKLTNIKRLRDMLSGVGEVESGENDEGGFRQGQGLPFRA